jgi:hypothetical protein
VAAKNIPTFSGKGPVRSCWPPPVADRGRLARYGGYPGRDKPRDYCLVVYEVGSLKARGRKP